MSGTIRYQVNLSGTGWVSDWQENGNEAGDSAGSMPLGRQCHGTDRRSGNFIKEVLYSVLQDSQWTEWASGRRGEAGAVGVVSMWTVCGFLW